MDRSITPQDYHDMKGRVANNLVLKKDKLTDLQQQTLPFKIYIQKEVPMLETSWNITGSQTVIKKENGRNGEEEKGRKV